MSEKTTWHYVMVLRFGLGGPNFSLIESNGTVDLAHGASRHDVFQQIRANMTKSAHEQESGLLPNPSTHFWSLEPDSLGGER